MQKKTRVVEAMEVLTAHNEKLGVALNDATTKIENLHLELTWARRELELRKQDKNIHYQEWQLNRLRSTLDAELNEHIRRTAILTTALNLVKDNDEWFEVGVEEVAETAAEPPAND